MINFNQDSGFVSAMTKCSPNIQRFIGGLNSGKDPWNEVSSFPVDWNFLNRLSCQQRDGEGLYFRVLDFYNSNIGMIQHGSIRSFDEQQSLFKIGRIIGTQQKIPVSIIPPEGLRGASVVFTDVVKTGSVVTNLAGGASYHNYGLACDIVLRHFGDSISKDKIQTLDGVVYDSFKKIYERAGILQWAKICNVEWGGFWSDFPDYAHFQDKEYKPLPYLIIADRCLQNEANCNFESVKKYWSGVWSNTFNTYKKQREFSMSNVLWKTELEKEARWQSWSVGRGSTKVYSDVLESSKDFSLKAILGVVFSLPVLMFAGLLFFSSKRKRG